MYDTYSVRLVPAQTLETTLVRFTLTIPTVDNDGNPILSVKHAHNILELHREDIPGWTSFEGFGYWTSSDFRVYAESVTVLAIDTDKPDRVREILICVAESLANRYSQEYVYLTEAPIVTYLIPPTES